jgi:hypothetical protein
MAKMLIFKVMSDTFQLFTDKYTKGTTTSSYVTINFKVMPASVYRSNYMEQSNS